MSAERSLVYGLDFGTSTSLLAVGRTEDARVDFVQDPATPDRQIWIPTAVCELPDGALAVGQAARDHFAANGDAYIDGFKRDFGGFTPESLETRSLRPDELATEVLRFLREQAELQFSGIVTATTIAVPTDWERFKRDLMLSAAERAGFDPELITLVEEPLAALAHVLTDTMTDDLGTALIYDLGAGTFDCALARPGDDGYRIVDTDGIADIGGADFDELLFRDLLKRPEVDGLLPENEDGRLYRQAELRRESERIKCGLSTYEVQERRLAGSGTVVRTDRAQFEELIRPKVRETLAKCDEMLRRHELTWDDIAVVAPVGGSSQIPLIRRMLARHTGTEVLKVTRPRSAVSEGAAVFARRSLSTAAGSIWGRFGGLQDRDAYSAAAIRDRLAENRVRKNDAIDREAFDRLPALRVAEARLEEYLEVALRPERSAEDLPASRPPTLECELRFALEYPHDAIVGAAYDASTLAFALTAGLVFAVDRAGGVLDGHLFHERGPVRGLASGNGFLAVGGEGGIMVAPAATIRDRIVCGRRGETYLSSGEPVVTLTFGEDERSPVVAAAGESTIAVFRPSGDTSSWRRTEAVPDAIRTTDLPVTVLALCGRGERPAVAAVTGRRYIDLWDPAEEDRFLRIEHSDVIVAVEAGELEGVPVLAFGDAGGTIVVCSPETGAVRLTLRRPGQEIRALAMGTVGTRQVIAAGGGNAIALWDVATGHRLTTLTLPDRVVSVSFSADGTTLAATTPHHIEVRSVGFL